MDACVLIMAGGLGSRMKSELPKVLHELDGIPMLVRVVREAVGAEPKRIFVVVGEYREDIRRVLAEHNVDKQVQFVHQYEALGTGHALQTGVPYLAKYASVNVVVLSGDVPCFSSKYIRKLGCTSGTTMVTRTVPGNTDSGRVMVDNNGFVKIVEMKDATEEEKKVDLINCGIYSMAIGDVMEFSHRLTNANAQNEYYITDMMEILRKAGRTIHMLEIPEADAYQLTGINTPQQLDLLEREIILRESSIRPLEVTDYYKGIFKLYANLSPTPRISHEGFISYVESLNADHQVWVVECGKSVSACITTLIEKKVSHDLKSVCHIEDVIVSPACRRNGYGRRLIEHALNYAQMKNCYKCVLYCTDELVEFYVRTGFQCFGKAMVCYF
jgi:UDP-N-acetylglucosamine pyrophosphorylase